MLDGVSELPVSLQMVPCRLTELDKLAGRAQARQEAQGSTPRSSGSA